MSGRTIAKIAIDQPGEETLYVTGRVSDFIQRDFADGRIELDLTVLIDGEDRSIHDTNERDAVYRHHDSTVDEEFDVELPEPDA